MQDRSTSSTSYPHSLNLYTLLTRREAAQLLKISPRTLDRMREECRGPKWIDLANGTRKKPQIRYRLIDLQNFLEELAS